MTKSSQSYRKSVSLSPFPVTNLRPEVELCTYCACTDNYRHKSRRKRCRAPKITVSV